MKTIKTLRESTNYWKGVPIGTVIAMLKDEEIEAVIKNGDGELVDHPDSEEEAIRPDKGRRVG